MEVKEYNPDRNGRMVARILVGGQDVSLGLVKAGLAWHYKKYSSDPVPADAEVDARRGRICRSSPQRSRNSLTGLPASESFIRKKAGRTPPNNCLWLKGIIPISCPHNKRRHYESVCDMHRLGCF